MSSSFLVALLSLCAGASGELTLEEALRRTEQQQPLLKAAAYRRESAEHAVSGARADLLPQVNLSAQGFIATANNPPTAWVSPVDIIRAGTRPAAYSDSSLWTPFGSTFVGVGVRQPLLDFSAYARLSAAKSTLAAAEAAAAFTYQQMLLRTADTFYRALAAEEDLAAATASLQRTRAQRGEAEAGVKAGLKPLLDSARAEANEAAAEARLHEARGMSDVARAALAFALGSRPEKLKEKLIRPPDTAAPSPKNQDAVRPDILALQAEGMAARARARAAFAAGLPQVSVVTSASFRGFADPLPRVPNWGVGLVATVPLYLGGGPRADAAQEEARANELQAREAAERDSASYQVIEGERLLAASTLSLSAAERQLQASKAGLAQAEARYRQGLGGIVELVDAQTQLAAAEQAIVRARLNVGLARVHLLYAGGGLRTGFPSPPAG
ncbi:MAG: TolC family protein [Myxococcaceae bacterium]